MNDTLSILQNAYWGNNPDESHILEELKSILPHYTCFVDIGASLGQYTKLAAEYLTRPDSYVLSFEPDITRFNLLVSNVMVWREQFKRRIFTHRWAISNKSTETTLYTSLDSHSASLVKNQHHRNEQTIRTVPLDAYTLSPNNLIKVDVEGSELEVLEGAEYTLSLKQSDWLIECYNFKDNTKSPVTEIMKNAGYKVTQFDSNHLFFEVKRG